MDSPGRMVFSRYFSVTVVKNVTIGGVMIPQLFVPPVMFVGMLLALWAWKCFWIIVMQDRLMYMSWMPPFSRSENIEDYEVKCRPVRWEESYFRSLDGTKLAICIGTIPQGSFSPPLLPSPLQHRKRHVVVCYFQGNGGSMPPRLPILSTVLRALSSTPSSPSAPPTEYTLVALSYRGYWKSSGRASQIGLERDAQAFLDLVTETYSTPDTDFKVVLWGHSLGSAVVSHTTPTYLNRLTSTEGDTPAHPLSGIVLETPSTSTKDILKNLYPQRWLPYRYLWPFLWNNWSSAAAITRIARWRDDAPDERRQPPAILLLIADQDEMIPSTAADELERLCRQHGLDAERKNVAGALHTEAVLKREGRETIVAFIRRVTQR
ncbi:hypothetical protein N7449_009688 [Penicillium cf. viridicatum]|uniref:AB hydrolase-1 domain-containing protein n=1 Tax=Penicillium cf. viridicatum TaxID=2972119 RepID=A0A9W9JFT4_9EURO|nr:hypothetical protein N7449_009688 [Penicillium cf. viridicatum]